MQPYFLGKHGGWREQSSLLSGYEDAGMLCLLYLNSKQFPLCLMSKQFHKHCRANVTQWHPGDFQPVFLAAKERISTKEAAPHILPSYVGVDEALGAAPGQSNSQEEETLIRMEPFYEWGPIQRSFMSNLKQPAWGYRALQSSCQRTLCMYPNLPLFLTHFMMGLGLLSLDTH